MDFMNSNNLSAVGFAELRRSRSSVLSSDPNSKIAQIKCQIRIGSAGIHCIGNPGADLK